MQNPSYLTKIKKNTFIWDFICPAVISIILAFIFKWNAKDLVWGFWGASFWLSMVFILFAFFLGCKYAFNPRCTKLFF
ncbi:uncharacterized membrane protein YqaE (UPF0057 family) [Elusimicrobium posterum]